MGRKPRESDYGLPPLTFAEAARVLGVDEGAFMEWTMKTARPSMSQWSEWTSGTRTVPEKLIRLYMTEQRTRPAVRAVKRGKGG